MRHFRLDLFIAFLLVGALGAFLGYDLGYRRGRIDGEQATLWSFVRPLSRMEPECGSCYIGGRPTGQTRVVPHRVEIVLFDDFAPLNQWGPPKREDE